MLYYAVPTKLKFYVFVALIAFFFWPMILVQTVMRRNDVRSKLEMLSILLFVVGLEIALAWWLSGGDTTRLVLYASAMMFLPQLLALLVMGEPAKYWTWI